MADEKTPATPAGNTANPEAIDVDAITQAAVKAATEAVNAAVTEAIKPITDQMAELKGDLAKAATPETVSKAVADAIAAQSETQAKASSRAEYIEKHLKNIPDAFHSMIGDDPEKWDAEAEKLRAALGKAGAKVDAPAPGSDPASGSDEGRKEIIAKIVKEKLGGNENLGKLLSATTEEELNTQADLIAAEAKKLRPDFGTEVDGGQTPNEQAEGDGSGFLKMPGAATPEPAATA